MLSTPSSLLDGERDWKLTALARREEQTPSSLLDGESDWRLTAFAGAGAGNLLHHPASWKGSRALRFSRRFVAVNLVHHRASSKGSGEPWPFRAARRAALDEYFHGVEVNRFARCREPAESSNASQERDSSNAQSPPMHNAFRGEGGGKDARNLPSNALSAIKVTRAGIAWDAAGEYTTDRIKRIGPSLSTGFSRNPGERTA